MSAVQFTVLIRLPFTRGNFVDPPQVDWNASKDRALWKVISKSSKTSDLDWVELAARFQVPPSFLLQQAAWLYERHFEHVRNQMKKVGGVSATTISGINSSQSAVGGIPMQRTGSAGSRNSTPSALSGRPRDSPILRGDFNITAPPTLSRTPSTNTITQSKAYSQQVASRPAPTRSHRPSITSPAEPTPPPPMMSPMENRRDSVDADSPSVIESSSDSSSSSSDTDHPIHRSQLFKRPPRFKAQRPRDLLSYDEAAEEGEENESSAKFPFAQAAGGTPVADTDASRQTQLSSPPDRIRQGPQSLKRGGTSGTGPRVEKGSLASAMEKGTDASSSMTSSNSDAPTRPSALSPKQRSNTGRVGSRTRKDGSEGMPSMGSSFSDIDDAGISQSALEEALLSNMQHGRMSTLSNFRSRYL